MLHLAFILSEQYDKSFVERKLEEAKQEMGVNAVLMVVIDCLHILLSHGRVVVASKIRVVIAKTSFFICVCQIRSLIVSNSWLYGRNRCRFIE